MSKNMIKSKFLNYLRRYRSASKSDAAQRKLIAKSPLFDEVFYYENAKKAGFELRASDSLSHYIEVGDKNHLAPHPFFDTKYYYDKYKDLVGMSTTALYHFLKHGARELRSPHPYIDPNYIIKQMGCASDNYLIDFLKFELGVVNPHPLIDISYIAEQYARNVTTSNVLYDFCAGLDRDICPSTKFDSEKFSGITNIKNNLIPFRLYLSANQIGNLDTNSLPELFADTERQFEEALEIEPTLLLQKLEVADIPIVRAYMSKRSQSDSIRKIDYLMPEKSIDHMIFAPPANDYAASTLLYAGIKYLLTDNPEACVCIISNDAASVCLDITKKSFDIHMINLYQIVDHELQHSFPELFSIYLQTISVANLHIVESPIGWNFLEKFGRQASRFVKLHVHTAGYSLDVKGRRSGYAWTHLPDCIQYISTVYTNSQELVSHLQADLAAHRNDSTALRTIDFETNLNIQE